ncbi:carboxylesterase family protein [Luminiphilus sp.]|nr:carboxylesterase family protein [Luminiphilus sp.]MDC6485844.1 carboxylesterase family protein [Luminiphilus sp.]
MYLTSKFVVLLMLPVLFLLGCSQPPMKSVPGTEVATESGRVVGVTGDEHVIHWQDIPFALPPEGALRWRAPQPYRNASSEIQPRESTICVQQAGAISETDGDTYVGSEDCLYLDVVAPTSASEQGLPVMFWIHGGGNTSGTKDTYDFSAFAHDQQVVVVTVNYRLGPFGWLTHPSIQDEAVGLDKSSNFGQLDIIAALEWTQRNIQGFGGDPNNVTIFGESAGGHNVYAMLVSPLTEGLFHRAIAQSPYTTSVTPRQAFNENREFPELDRGSWELVQSLGLNSETTSVGALRSINAYDIMAAYYSLDKDHLSPLSTADGIVIPKVGIEQALLDPQYAKSVPVLSGSNRDEVTLWMGLNRYFVNGDPVLFGLLPPRMSIKNENTYRYWVDLRSRAWKARGVDQALLNLGQAGYAQLYSYRFDWDEQAESWFISFPKLLGATHGGEIAFVMGAPMFGPIGDYMYPDTDSAQELTDIMMTAWGNFARTGAPGAVAGKDWPPFLAEAPHTMVLDGVADIRVDMASPTLGQLLREIEAPSSLDSAERCLLMWEMVTNIGQPLYDDYARWNNGECAEFDVRGTKAAIENALIETYGSTSLP